MTQSVNCEFFGLDRFGLSSPPYPGLETIRNQTLPKAITDWRVSPQGGSALSAYFGGFADIARRAAFQWYSDCPRTRVNATNALLRQSPAFSLELSG
jgi:hypothetical protein